MEASNKKYRSHYIKNLLLPCLCFSVVTGIISAILISLFKSASDVAVGISENIYASARTSYLQLPVLVAFAALIGFVASLILTFSHSCKGGGIPTSIAAIRGIIGFKWLKSAFLLPLSALLSFLCGMPLGTEGPCVQMGTAIGNGAVKLFGGKKHRGWTRYMMTGGASAGFALATGAPITAIIFAMEEVHRRFSPLLFLVSALSVAVSQLTTHALSAIGLHSHKLFYLDHIEPFPHSYFIAPIVIGILCGVCSIFFTRFYNFIDKHIRSKLGRLSVMVKFPIIFAIIAVIGVFCAYSLGSGHSLIEHLFEREFTFYVIIIFFVLRAVMMMISNTAGVTGGIFLPTLAFGAMIGALTAEGFIAFNDIFADYYEFFVILGMASFLGASSKIPVTACVFAIEVLGGTGNIHAVIIAVTTAFLTLEASGLDDFTDTVIKMKAKAIHKGKEAHTIEVPLTVREGSFVIDKELRDILWPASCVFLSIEKGPNRTDKLGVAAGDILTVRYKTYDPVATAAEFEILVGDQSKETDKIMRPQ